MYNGNPSGNGVAKTLIVHLKTVVLILVMACVFTAWQTPALAGDLDSAKRQLEKAKADVDNAAWDDAEQQIKTTEEFLDGLPDADRAPVLKDLQILKDKTAVGQKATKSKTLVTVATSDLDHAADEMNSNYLVASDYIDKAIARISSDDAKKYVAPEAIAKIQARAASLQSMVTTKKYAQHIDQANVILKILDETMVADPFKDLTGDQELSQAGQRIKSLMDRIRGQLEGIPAADPRVKAITDKLAIYTKQVDTASGALMAKQAAADLSHQWKAQQEYFAGWDDEKQGTTWVEYTTRQSEMTSSLNMPKTIELLTRMNPWLADKSITSIADQYKDDASIKGTMAEARKFFDAAGTKLHGALVALLDEAEKVETPSEERVRDVPRQLADRADMWLKGTPYHDQDVARAKKLFDKWNSAVAGGVAARQELLAKLTAQAASAWPAVAASIKAEDGFTPDKLDAYKGKTIHLSGNNRVAWDYEPGAYHYARTINGLVVAGKYDKNVAAAVAAAVKQTGQSLPDDNWDIFAVVEAPGKIKERTSTSGNVRVNGSDVGTYTEEGHKSVDCAIVRIIAMHAGPVAVGPSGNAAPAPESPAAGAAGSPAIATTPVAAGAMPVAASAAVVSGSSALAAVEHIGELLLCLIGAGLVLVKSRPALMTQAVGAAPSISTVAASDNIAMAGLGLAGLGLLWLLAKLIIGDLLPALALTLTGVYVASDWLRARNIIPQTMVDSMKPLGVPLAGSAVLFGVLHLFLAHWYLF